MLKTLKYIDIFPFTGIHSDSDKRLNYCYWDLDERYFFGFLHGVCVPEVVRVIGNVRRDFSWYYFEFGPPLWSSGQSFWLQIQRSRVRFPALPDFSE